MMVAEWVPQGARRIASAIWDLFIVVSCGGAESAHRRRRFLNVVTLQAMKLLIVAIPLIVIIPTVFGVYFQLVFLAPSKVSSAQVSVVTICL